MCGRRWLCLLVLLLLAPGMPGQNAKLGSSTRVVRPSRVIVDEPRPFPPFRPPVARPPIITAPGRSGFAQLTRPAGIIFAGTVTRIERVPEDHEQAIAITFHVESGIRGIAAGRALTITQWAGLWSFGQRYRVGERVLLFLYPRSKLGLTSSVGGPLGRFALDSSGLVLLTAQQMEALRTDSVLGGKSRLPLSDFALAVRRSGEEE